jgi:putative hydrolase of the HAD superfamily
MVDVDGVVVVRPGGRRWDADLTADLGLDSEQLQDAFFGRHWGDVLFGRADLHERLAPVLAEIAPHLTSKALVDYWFAQDSHLDGVLLEDLAAVRRAGAELHLATLQEHHRARYLWEDLDLKSRFDAMHYAAELGCGKPDPAFFRVIEARTGRAPAELLLIDDSVKNVEGARACGWDAVLWDGSRRLADVLAEAGSG